MSRKIDTILLDAKTAINAVGTVIDVADMANSDKLAFYAIFDHTTSAGVVTIETSYVGTYAGTWASLGTLTWTAIDSVKYLAISTPVRAIRARVSTTIADGTVSVYVVGNAT